MKYAPNDLLITLPTGLDPLSTLSKYVTLNFKSSYLLGLPCNSVRIIFFVSFVEFSIHLNKLNHLGAFLVQDIVELFV